LHMKQECYLLCDDAWCVVLQKDIYDVKETCIIPLLSSHMGASISWIWVGWKIIVLFSYIMVW
jgi:hypothetical protein